MLKPQAFVNDSDEEDFSEWNDNATIRTATTTHSGIEL